MKSKKVIVIGGGPAGMMAAGVAAQNGADVTLFEKNEKTGRKLLITGKGRCNITNFCDNDEFISNIPTNPRFMYSAINAFSTYDTVAFFEDLGVATKVERGNRVFPVSDKAMDVCDALRNFVLQNGVKLLTANIKALVQKDGEVLGVKTDSNESFFADSIVVSTGGKSYPKTGSTGDGYKFAKSVGHSVNTVTPSLVPLVSNDYFCKELQGLSLKNVALKVVENISKKEIYSDFGEMLFTHFGLSGPTILSASAHMKDMSENKYSVHIDLKPALDRETLDKRLLKDLQKFINKDICNSLFELLPKSFVPVLLRLCNIDPHTKCNSITVSQRYAIVDTLKDLTVSIKGFRPIDEAIITCGGVNVNEIDPKTMRSKIVPNLYFAGEVLDVDAYTGGFNLQIAFSTGYLAGMNSSLD
ncbi:MAG: NAD(P)/FAD-dependent oxidoreductase [Ruminococcaceae bacterium]|nr:NAD(P)/FAD-dependent oxidoreductase [Oscillospiraceae bacterium]